MLLTAYDKTNFILPPKGLFCVTICRIRRIASSKLMLDRILFESRIYLGELDLNQEVMIIERGKSVPKKMYIITIAKPMSDSERRESKRTMNLCRLMQTLLIPPNQII